MKSSLSYEELQQRVNALEQAELNRSQAGFKLQSFEKQSLVWLEHSPVCTKIVDLDGNLQYMSCAGIQALDIDDVTEFYGTAFPFRFYTEPSFSNMVDGIKTARRTCRVVALDAELKADDGTRYWFHQNIVPVTDAKGELDYIIIVSSDITERKQAEEQLKKLYDELEARVKERTVELTAANKRLNISKQLAEQATRSKSQFLANMSHEIRTPLSGVLGVAGLLEETALDNQQQHYLQVIKNAGSTLLSVINDILDYSKIEAGRLELELSPFSIRRFIEEILEIYRLQLSDHIKLTVNLDDNIPEYLMGDTVRLNQVLNNVLNNAFKFTEQGEIAVTIKLQNLADGQASIRFIVSDTGIGISPEQQFILFEAFTQADQSTSRQYGGTGLGLAICQRLVEQMGGEISLDSEKGVGSTFQFAVSLAVAEQAKKKTASVQSLQNFSSINVLMAEDNDVNQMINLGLMNKLGVQAQIVSDGQEVLDMVCKKQKHFDLIFMDCEMPNMDGYEATKQIRQWEQKNGVRKTPIYALTAHALPEHIRLSQEVGMDGHLAKPVTLERLRDVVRGVAIKDL